jgi:hypothetical protein
MVYLERFSMKSTVNREIIDALESEWYTDDKGYPRYVLERDGVSSLVHRQVAYQFIYLRDRKSYPMPFSEYVVHHKDEKKLNYQPNNLEVLTEEEHKERHAIVDSWFVIGEKSSFLEGVLFAIGYVAFLVLGIPILIFSFIMFLVFISLLFA